MMDLASVSCVWRPSPGMMSCLILTAFVTALAISFAPPVLSLHRCPLALVPTLVRTVSILIPCPVACCLHPVLPILPPLPAPSWWLSLLLLAPVCPACSRPLTCPACSCLLVHVPSPRSPRVIPCACLPVMTRLALTARRARARPAPHTRPRLTRCPLPPLVSALPLPALAYSRVPALGRHRLQLPCLYFTLARPRLPLLCSLPPCHAMLSSALRLTTRYRPPRALSPHASVTGILPPLTLLAMRCTHGVLAWPHPSACALRPFDLPRTPGLWVLVAPPWLCLLRSWLLCVLVLRCLLRPLLMGTLLLLRLDRPLGL